ncbi:hypothetical protein E4O00_12800 [Treponema sp. OMZ 788]|uniref:hypothetical protein n=1 Tax=Treponema sp. OMZ 788 TaxID=2563664 RepID=UPI0020A5EBC0|nr:hypothetical protein [Treponema sp. OMZ 788]UTC64611.1 hypothetical protein E4O00_12800 [Treponema sp. OMZ 788]
MKTTYNLIKKFLENPEDIASFMKSDAIVWVDHREYDEDIVTYFNEKMGNQIEMELKDNGKSYGEDIYLKYKDKSLMIPYKDNMDRDTTIIWTNEIVKEDYSIRLFAEEMGDDAFGFSVLSHDEWELLEKSFGNTFHKFFYEITPSSRMFSLEYDVVEYVRLKKINPETTFLTLIYYLEIMKKELILAEKKARGEMDLKTYFQQKKEIKAEKDAYVLENGLKL